MKEKEVSKDTISKIPLEEVSERGSLGLLAFGAVGLNAWRKKKEEAAKEKQSTQKP